ncbi:MAG: hypothetical protein Q4A71_07255 [Actinomycetaceae bacterium]|nr:hypothetical protein [Actinomycetaceae bacterium]
MTKNISDRNRSQWSFLGTRRSPSLIVCGWMPIYLTLPLYFLCARILHSFPLAGATAAVMGCIAIAVSVRLRSWQLTLFGLIAAFSYFIILPFEHI